MYNLLQVLYSMMMGRVGGGYILFYFSVGPMTYKSNCDFLLLLNSFVCTVLLDKRGTCI